MCLRDLIPNFPPRAAAFSPPAGARAAKFWPSRRAGGARIVIRPCPGVVVARWSCGIWPDRRAATSSHFAAPAPQPSPISRTRSRPVAYPALQGIAPSPYANTAERRQPSSPRALTRPGLRSLAPRVPGRSVNSARCGRRLTCWVGDFCPLVAGDRADDGTLREDRQSWRVARIAACSERKAAEWMRNAACGRPRSADLHGGG
jgi:hypothetical protein